MACSCNSTPCGCRVTVCCTPIVESVEYTFENGNLIGIGVFDNDTDNLVQFRGIVSNSAALTVTLDAGNNVIVLDFDDAALVADIPDATTTQRGILETATNAEALAKAATDKILTPSNLAALGGTTTFAGLLELATDAETIAGVSTTLAVTPAGLAAVGATYGTTTWADGVARAAAVPTFAGQFGTQLDTDIAWIATSTVAGGFDRPLLVLTKDNVSDNDATQIDFTGGSYLQLDSTDASGVFIVNIPMTLGALGSLTVNGTLEVAGTFDLNGAQFEVAGIAVPANSVLITAGAGVPSSALRSTFLSTANVQTGWGTPSSTLARTTFATYAGAVISNPPTQAEVQAINDALVIVSQRLGALITDLKAVLLPAT